jgi:hypothetical protein
MKLATMVLKGEISVDQGLIRAQTGKVLDEFIDGLNVLAQGDYFDPVFAYERIRNGNALRALEGRIPGWELPSNLKNWSEKSLRDSTPPGGVVSGSAVASPATPAAETTATEGPPAPPPADRQTGMQEDRERSEKARSQLSSLNDKLRNLRSQRRESRSLLQLLEYFDQNRRDSPRPWMGGVILMGCTLLLAYPVSLFLESKPGLFFFLLTGFLVSVVVVRREMTWSEHVHSTEQVMSEHRKVNMEVQKNLISNLDREIREARSQAHELVDSFQEKERKELVNSFLEIFTKPSADRDH